MSNLVLVAEEPILFGYMQTLTGRSPPPCTVGNHQAFWR